MSKYMKLRFFAVIAVLLFVLPITACGNIIDFTKGEQEGQFRQVEVGDTMAEIVIEGYGSVYAYIFEDTVAGKNFIKLAEDGYYNNKNIDRLIKDYLIQVDFADKSEETLAEDRHDEEAAEFHPYSGALCAAASGKGFFVVHAGAETMEQIKELVEFEGYDIRSYLKAAYNVELTEEELEKYFEYGGAPWLHGNYEVFGQVCAGTSVFDDIVEAAVDEKDSPIEKIVITEIRIYEHEE